MVSKCGKPTGRSLSTVVPKMQVATYMVNMTLPNDVRLAAMTMTKGVLSGVDALIGMDVIGPGGFAVSNFGGRILFSFRMPLSQEIRPNRFVLEDGDPRIEDLRNASVLF